MHCYTKGFCECYQQIGNDTFYLAPPFKYDAPPIRVDYDPYFRISRGGLSRNSTGRLVVTFTLTLCENSVEASNLVAGRLGAMHLHM